MFWDETNYKNMAAEYVDHFERAVDVLTRPAQVFKEEEKQMQDKLDMQERFDDPMKIGIDMQHRDLTE